MENVWQPGPKSMEISENELQIWLANLNGESETLKYYQGLLTPEENQRAARFKFREHQKRFIFGRGILRELLGRYLQKSPEQIEIHAGPYGKPYLTNNQIKFNLAHSHGLGLYGFSLKTELGVDIEGIRDVSHAEEIAERFFSSQEYEDFLAVPVEKQMEQFFFTWTLKEAFIKATGKGLSYPLDAFAVSPLEGISARLLIFNQEEESKEWSMFTLRPNNKCIAAAAIRGGDWRLNRFQYQMQ